MDIIAQLEAFFNRIHPLSEQALEEIKLKCTKRELPKNYYLIREGENCSHIWIVLRGLVRNYYTDRQGKEVNTWFSDESSVSTATTIFGQVGPSPENIQLLEDSILYELPIADLRALLQQHHSLCLWCIKALESIYISHSEKRMDELFAMDAKSRYEKLLLEHPSFIHRISLGNLASYLHISKETLSRIRSAR